MISDLIAVPVAFISIGLWVVVAGSYFINGWVSTTMAIGIGALFFSILAVMFLLIPRAYNSDKQGADKQ